jgi:hypothetical protein
MDLGRRTDDAGHPTAKEPPDPETAEGLTEKLIEKREKLEYFMVTAATAVIVFTLNDFNKMDGVLRSANRTLLLAGWACLLAAAGFALFAIRSRHSVYSLAIDVIRAGTPLEPDKDAKRVAKQKWIGRALNGMAVLFVAGVAVLALAYVFALDSP